MILETISQKFRNYLESESCLDNLCKTLFCDQRISHLKQSHSRNHENMLMAQLMHVQAQFLHISPNWTVEACALRKKYQSADGCEPPYFRLNSSPYVSPNWYVLVKNYQSVFDPFCAPSLKIGTIRIGSIEKRSAVDGHCILIGLIFMDRIGFIDRK